MHPMNTPANRMLAAQAVYQRWLRTLKASEIMLAVCFLALILDVVATFVQYHDWAFPVAAGLMGMMIMFSAILVQAQYKVDTSYSVVEDCYGQLYMVRESQ